MKREHPANIETQMLYGKTQTMGVVTDVARKQDPWAPMPMVRRKKYWMTVRRLLAEKGHRTFDDRVLAWTTLEYIAAARGFSAWLVDDPKNMADVLDRLFAPPNF